MTVQLVEKQNEFPNTGINRHVSRYIDSLPDLTGKVVVDIPCGDGRSSYGFKKKGATVHAFDLYPEFMKVDGLEARYADLMGTISDGRLERRLFALPGRHRAHFRQNRLVPRVQSRPQKRRYADRYRTEHFSCTRQVDDTAHRKRVMETRRTDRARQRLVQREGIGQNLFRSSLSGQRAAPANHLYAIGFRCPGASEDRSQQLVDRAGYPLVSAHGAGFDGIVFVVQEEEQACRRRTAKIDIVESGQAKFVAHHPFL